MLSWPSHRWIVASGGWAVIEINMARMAVSKIGHARLDFSQRPLVVLLPAAGDRRPSEALQISLQIQRSWFSQNLDSQRLQRTGPSESLFPFAERLPVVAARPASGYASAEATTAVRVTMRRLSLKEIE